MGSIGIFSSRDSGRDQRGVRRRLTAVAWRLLAGAVGLVSLVACQHATPPPANYASYGRIYDSPGTLRWRALMKSLPCVRERAFYGNYGGSGNLGGKPIDRLDSLCRKHDILYNELRALPTLRLADRVFAEELRKLDPATLSPVALEFRNRGIRFMESPWANFIGKTLQNRLTRCEPPDTPFRSIDDIRRFFHLPDGTAEVRFLSVRKRRSSSGRRLVNAAASPTDATGGWQGSLTACRPAG